jgi:DNA polymerase-3 subunit delta'
MALRDIKGQDRALGMLRGAIGRGRVASSYLFAGEAGVGKRLTAMNFAKALNCLEPLDGDSCDRCASCRKIDALAHPDMAVVEPEGLGGQIKVEQVRAVEEALSLKPHEARVKFVLVDDAEQMNASAANAFLKTLEEPTPSSLIVLVSAAWERLPRTILSRCARIPFRPLSPGLAEDVIASRLGGKRAKQAGELARLSMGRPGLAISEDLVKRRDKAIDAIDLMLAGETKPAWKDRREIERWFDMALILLRDIEVLAITGGTDGFVNADIAEEVARRYRGVRPEGVLDVYRAVRDLRAGLIFNPNKGITWNHTGGVLRGLGGGRG